MANLTQIEFLTIADLYPEGINIWCTEDIPINIIGVTVPLVDNGGNNLEATLRQIQTITLPVDNSTQETVELVITSRVIRGTFPYKYYFFTVRPVDISEYVSPTSNEVLQGKQVILLPDLRGESFTYSEYNITLNTAQENRTSKYVRRSDLVTFADIQDSVYSDTGWVNARYRGTLTNSQNYLTIDSAILGSSLQGTYYPAQTPDTEINSIDVGERSYLEYFHTGLSTYPIPSVNTSALFYIDAAYSPSASALVVYPSNQNSPLRLYQPGDLVMVSGSAEIMKVRTLTRLTANNDYRMEVVRGWNNTPKVSIPSATVDLFKLNTIRIFELERNRPSPVKQGKIRLKDTGHIIYTDLLGYITSGSAYTSI